MSKNANILQFAKKLVKAAPQRDNQNTSSSSSSTNTTMLSSSSTSATSIDAASSSAATPVVKFELPEKLKDVPPHLFSCVSLDKLAMQHDYLEFPEWCAMPTEHHPDVHFEVTKPKTQPKQQQDQKQQQDKKEEQQQQQEKEVVKLPAIKLGKYPFYIFGSNEKICDIKLEHPSISRVHLAVVHHQNGAVCVRDLKSSNGVFLITGNKQKIRLDPASYVPIKEGDQIQLGTSSKILTLKFNLPSSHNNNDNRQTAAAVVEKKEEVIEKQQQQQQRREREEEQQQIPTPHSDSAAATATVTTSSDNSTETTSINVQQDTKHEQQKETVQEEEEKQEQPEEEEAKSVRLVHLLIKHKDLEKPVSRAPRNKGEKITRSNSDAKTLIEAIREQIIRDGLVASNNNNNKNILKNEQMFEEAVQTHSECASAKTGGDMGVIEKGSLPNLPEFEQIALRLSPLEISDVVETHLGFHILFRRPDQEE